MAETVSEEELDRFLRAYAALAEKHKYCQLQVDFDTLLAIVSQVQLALRHPGNKGPGSMRARKWLGHIYQMFEAQDPLVASMLRLGESPAHDVPVPPEKAGGG
jgi:hypothetical protein